MDHGQEGGTDGESPLSVSCQVSFRLGASPVRQIVGLGLGKPGCNTPLLYLAGLTWSQSPSWFIQVVTMVKWENSKNATLTSLEEWWDVNS